MLFGITGFIILSVFMIFYHDYMNAFVSLTISFIFIFGLIESSNKKSAFAHLISGNVIGMIFNVYYMISVMANGFDSLINDGEFKFNPLVTFLISTITLCFNAFSLLKFKDQLKAKNDIIK